MGQAVAARRFNTGGGYNTTNANPGVDRGRQDYSGYAMTVLVKSGDRGSRRAQRFVGERGGVRRAPEAAETPCRGDGRVCQQRGEQRGVCACGVHEHDDSGRLPPRRGRLRPVRRRIALGDWARGRWTARGWRPRAFYYGMCVGGLDTPEDPVKAVHPVPWAVSPPSSPTASVLPPTDEAQHRGPPGSPPPSYALTEAAHTAHARQMRAVLLPAFCNVVRRIIVECALDAFEADDARLAAPGTSTPRKPLDPAVQASCASCARRRRCGLMALTGASGGGTRAQRWRWGRVRGTPRRVVTILL
ncbi:hypothetical protein C8R44DRAFT_116860 [Mycena epipterygia]|nr:hypothetical protein C8R44DRAFT_116860 [Mycena epipterygia]